MKNEIFKPTLAIILSGNIRTWELCKDSFINTFNGLNPDIFVSTYDRKYEYHPYIKSQLPPFDEVILSNDDIISFLSELNVVYTEIENSAIIDRMVEIRSLSFNENMTNIDSCYKQFRKIQNCTKKIIKYENENDFKYDYIIKARFDTPFNNTDVFPSDDTKVLINNVAVQPSDWFISSKRDNFINVIDFMMNEFYEFKYHNSNDRPPHQLFQNAINHNNLTFEHRYICSNIIRQYG